MQASGLESRLLTLEFRDPAAEACFRRYFHATLRSHDTTCYWVYLTVNLIFNVLFAVNAAKRTPAGALPTLLYSAAILAHGACLLLLPPAAYTRHRCAVVAAFRLTYLAVAAFGIPRWFFSTPPATPAASFSLVIIGSGVVMTNYTALGMLVPVKPQLALQLLAVALYACWLNADTCRLLQRTPAGTDFIAAAWTWGSKASKFLISIYHPVPMLHIPLPKPPVFAMCLNLMAFLQLVVCYLLPTAAAYAIEATMRHSFLARHYQAAARQPPQGWHQAMASFAMLLFCWSIGLIMAWEVLCTLFIVLHRRDLLLPA